MVGHEIGHFRNQDHLRSLGRQVTVALTMAVLSGSSVSGSVDVLGFAQIVAERSFSRDQESTADEFGVQAVYAEYGHIQGVNDFFKKISHNDLLTGSRLGRYFATHPHRDDRIRALNALAEDRRWPIAGPLKAFTLPPGQEAELDR